MEIMRTSYIIRGTQYKIKMWGPLFKNYYEFQDGDQRALNMFEWGFLCNSPVPSS